MKNGLVSIIGLVIFILIVTACASPKEAGEDTAPNSYLESVEKYNTFNAIDFVYEPTGCHFLITNTPDNHGNSRTAVVQMLGPDGKPYCE